MTEYLFRKPGLLDETIETAIENDTFRADDLEFTFAARVSSYLHFHISRDCRLLLTFGRVGPNACLSVTSIPTKTVSNAFRNISNRDFQTPPESATR